MVGILAAATVSESDYNPATSDYNPATQDYTPRPDPFAVSCSLLRAAPTTTPAAERYAIARLVPGELLGI